MKAFVNKIISQTFIDGPGSRLAVFLQGCNMGCLYCHNPETQRFCNACGRCVEICPARALHKVDGKIKYDPAACRNCDLCIKECPNFSSPKYKEMDVDEVFSQILAAADFLDGITVSGGECTTQPEFVYGLFKKVKEQTSLTTFLDTNGLMGLETLKKLCTVTDGFMFDLKALDKEIHRRLTGVDNDVILRNMQFVSERGLLYEVRTVAVEGFTDSPQEIEKIASFIKDLNDYTRFKLIPFRPLGVKTYLADHPPLPAEKLDKLYSVAYQILGDRVVKGK